MQLCFSRFSFLLLIVPNGVITFRRYVLAHNQTPKWSDSKKRLCPIQLRMDKRIEDVEGVLQVCKIVFFVRHHCCYHLFSKVDFANKYIVSVKKDLFILKWIVPF